MLTDMQFVESFGCTEQINETLFKPRVHENMLYFKFQRISYGYSEISMDIWSMIFQFYYPHLESTLYY